MQGTSVEIENRIGAGGVVVARFETAADKVGQFQIAGGARQTFKEFDRLTVTAMQKAGHLRLFNHARVAVQMTQRTATGQEADREIPPNGFADVTVLVGDQLFVLPKPAIMLPEQPVLFMARFEPVHPPPLFAPNQKPGNFHVRLAWSHPLQNSPDLWGYNVYRAVYRADEPLSLEALNGIPQAGTTATVLERKPRRPFDHRYAVTAVNHAGMESLFSNVRILNWRTRVNLFDAGFVPL